MRNTFIDGCVHQDERGGGKDDIDDDPPVGVLAEILMARSVEDVDAQVVVIKRITIALLS